MVPNGWSYLLQGPDGEAIDLATLATSAPNLLVTDSSRDGSDAGRWNPADLALVQQSGKAVYAYLTIGEVDDYRSNWSPAWTTTGKAAGRPTSAAPAWLGPVNPDWRESRKVRFWDPTWRAQLTNPEGSGLLDQIVAQGFDGVYLDIIDAYTFWAEEVKRRDRRPGDPARGDLGDSAGRMADLVTGLSTAARRVNPAFQVILQNGEGIFDHLGAPGSAARQQLLDGITGLAVEDAYCPGPRDEDNRFKPVRSRLSQLREDVRDAGKLVLTVEYLTRASLIDRFLAAASADGFLPTVSPSRDLDQLAAPVLSGL